MLTADRILRMIITVASMYILCLLLSAHVLDCLWAQASMGARPHAFSAGRCARSCQLKADRNYTQHISASAKEADH